MNYLLKSNFGQCLVFIIAALAMHSCSCNKVQDLSSKLAAIAGDETQLIATGNIAMLFNQLDVEVKDGHPVLPQYLQLAVNRFTDSDMRRDINDVVSKVEGVEYDNAVLTFDTKGESFAAVLVFGVSDPGVFAKSVGKITKDAKTGSFGNFTTVSFNDAKVLLKDNLGFVVVSDDGCLDYEKAAEFISERQLAATEKPLSSWKKEYLTQENIVNCLVSNRLSENVTSQIGIPVSLPNSDNLKIADGFTGFTFGLDAQTLRLTGVNLDPEGKAIANPYVGKFNTSLMDYAADYDFAALSFCMTRQGYETLAEGIEAQVEQLKKAPGFNSYAYGRILSVVLGASRLPAEYLSDAGAFIALGFVKDATVASTNFGSPAGYHFVVAADLIPEKSAEGYNLLCDELTKLSKTAGKMSVSRSGNKCSVAVKYGEDYDYLRDEWTYVTVDINIELTGNTLVISNAPISKSAKNVFNKEFFAESMCSAQIVLNGSTPVISQFGIKEGLDAHFRSGALSNELTVKITGTDKKFFPAVLGFLGGTTDD